MTDKKSFARGLASPFRLKCVIKYRLYKTDQRIHLLTNKLRELSVANIPFSYQSPTLLNNNRKALVFLHLVCSVYSRKNHIVENSSDL
jgi:hypothetical protein